MDHKPFQILTFGSRGLIKVVESTAKTGESLSIIKKWGKPNSENCILRASINGGFLAVARKNSRIEVLDPVNGDVLASIRNAEEGRTAYTVQDSNVSITNPRPYVNGVVGLHVFKTQPKSRSCSLLTCTTNGAVSMGFVNFSDSPGQSTFNDTSISWSVCPRSPDGDILCCKVHDTENYAVFGGKGVEINVWALETRTAIGVELPSKIDGIFTPTFCTSATFLNKKDHRKIVVGTNRHKVLLYDLSANTKPSLSFSFECGDSPIQTIIEDEDGKHIYVANRNGGLVAYDMRSGELEYFSGATCGNIESAVRHPSLPVIVSCGLDRYLRVWNTNLRKLISEVSLKQPLTDLLLDPQFNYGGEVGEDVGNRKRKRSTEGLTIDERKTKNSKKESKGLDEEEEAELEQKNASKDVDGSNKSNSNKKKNQKKIGEA